MEAAGWAGFEAEVEPAWEDRGRGGGSGEGDERGGREAGHALAAEEGAGAEDDLGAADELAGD